MHYRKSTVFWNQTPSSFVDEYRRAGGAHLFRGQVKWFCDPAGGNRLHLNLVQIARPHIPGYLNLDITVITHICCIWQQAECAWNRAVDRIKLYSRQ